jgi:hypothetical protein
MIREKLDEIITLSDEATLARVRHIISELRQPFAHFATDQGKEWAYQERKRREAIAEVLEVAFKIK